MLCATAWLRLDAAVGDYDGTVTQLHLESGHLISEGDEHGGKRWVVRQCWRGWSCCGAAELEGVIVPPRLLTTLPPAGLCRVWSVSHSPLVPGYCASASDDGTVRLWSGPSPHRACGVLRPPGPAAPLCSVQLSPHDANLLALASSDCLAYVFDLRRPDQPLHMLEGHSRAVSAARWMGRRRLVTASVDASLAVWDLGGEPRLPPAALTQAAAAAADGGAAVGTAFAGSAGTGAAPLRPRRHCLGHTNSKNFVGLAVRAEDELIACGSEAAACFCYSPHWATPLVRHPLLEHLHHHAALDRRLRAVVAVPRAGTPPLPGSCGAAAAAAGDDAGSCPGGAGGFCCAVAWQPTAAAPGAPPLLAAALSNGEVRILALQQPASSRLTLPSSPSNGPLYPPPPPPPERKHPGIEANTCTPPAAQFWPPSAA